MLAYVPALSLLIFFLIVTLIVLQKFSGDQLAKAFEAENVLLLFATILFCVLLVVHLFKEQSWTADILKIVAGILVGAVAAYSASSKTGKNKMPEGRVQRAIGSDIQQAGRDIIGQMQGDIKGLKDSVINQFSTIQERLSDLENQAENYSSIPVIGRSESFQVQITDQNFISELDLIRKERADWTKEWIDRCISNPDLQVQIDKKIELLEKKGWQVVEMVLDTRAHQLWVSLSLKKRYKS